MKVMCVLHNNLLAAKDHRYTPPGFVDTVEQDCTITEGFWRQSQLRVLGADGYSSRRATQEANAVRQHLVQYFSSCPMSMPDMKIDDNKTSCKLTLEPCEVIYNCLVLASHMLVLLHLVCRVVCSWKLNDHYQSHS